jgi:hypothetical protein
MAVGSTSVDQKWISGIILGVKARPAREAENLTAVC